jgi:hypothetical protein
MLDDGYATLTQGPPSNRGMTATPITRAGVSPPLTEEESGIMCLPNLLTIQPMMRVTHLTDQQMPKRLILWGIDRF